MLKGAASLGSGLLSRARNWAYCTAAMGEIAQCVRNLKNFESGRVKDQVEMRFLENRVRV